MPSKYRAEYVVKGFVQGVGYRYFAYVNAKRLRLTGFVRNLYDGSVQAVAIGEKAELEQYYEILKQGPSRSNVEAVSYSITETTEEYMDFNIK